MIGKYAIVLFGHAPVERAQPRLDVRDGNFQLARCQGAGEGGIGVSVHEHPVGTLLDHHLLEGDEHAPRHGAMRPASHFEIAIGAPNSHLIEEDLRHPIVVVLTGMHEVFVDRRLLECSSHRPRLDELWACANDCEDLHGRCSVEGMGAMSRLTYRLVGMPKRVTLPRSSNPSFFTKPLATGSSSSGLQNTFTSRTPSPLR